MSQIVVGVSDCKWSDDPAQVLVTYALGSCIGVVLHDPVAKVGGILHYMLPDSRVDREKAVQNPYMFADTGVPLLLSKVCSLGGELSRISVRIAGGARVLDMDSYFDIGKRNYLALRKVLWKAGLMIHAAEVGGSVSRTVSLELATGRCGWRESTGKTGELLIRKRPSSSSRGSQRKGRQAVVGGFSGEGGDNVLPRVSG